MNVRDKSGFTLIELIVVALLGTIVVASTYQIMLTSQRTLMLQSAQLQGQQTVRAGMDILVTELRELSGAEGDILTMGSDRIEMRAMRAFGLVCNVGASGSPIRVKKIGGFFGNGDSIVVLADNDPDDSADDTILSGVVSSIDTSQTCTGADTAQALIVPALSTALATDTVRAGAPIRGFKVYTYGLYTVDGAPYLARKTSTATVPLVGPLAADGVSFVYLDSFGHVTTVPEAVSRIEVTLRSSSNIVDPTGVPVADALKTAIYLRN